ncbi:YtxH domain-containing protein [Gordonia sp. C13]|uniref:YtxH domain-containing protein n=1 Tax=Gordonia sp. C13 TaxID=2935078 RepID=UPI002009F5DE|nr:YtxH domain-containing protein [Gordonia sp. C13]MCK8616182.1 YtxH domain-containing protein [Gordonia sp. C13]
MSRTVRTPDAFMRVAAAGVVPTVAIAAHGAAGGQSLSSGGVVLTVAIGVAAALLLQPAIRGRRLVPAAAAATSVLTAAQVGSHGALAADAAHVTHDAPALPMLLTHLVAIPLSAVLIVVGAQLLAVIGSVIASLTPPVALRIPGASPVFWTQPAVLAGPAVGGTGVRGPPLGF